jgi:electron transfer flavoprotein alpha subunit
MKIITFIQSTDGKINTNSIEAFTASQKIAEKNNAEIYLLTFDESLVNKLSEYKSNGVIFANNSELKTYNPIYYTSALESVFNKYSPDLLFFGHTYETRDWVPRLSARINLPFVSDATDFNLDNGLSFTRPVYQAKLNEKVSLDNNGIISYQAGSFNPEELITQNSQSEKIDLDFSSIKLTVHPGEKFRESANEVDLSSAEIIVSIGRGIGKEENIHIAETLATKLNAQIAASRPVVDSGWLDHSRQVGSSGQIVSPKLYLSVGISGAIQHLVGMKGSKSIVAINKDPNAPIFEIADYAIIGDLFEILPKLTEQL